jgi:hypothetical protein
MMYKKNPAENLEIPEPKLATAFHPAKASG